jgi:hypothetical protein
VQFNLDRNFGLDDRQHDMAGLCDRVAAEHGDVRDPQAGIQERRDQRACDLPEVGCLDAASRSCLDLPGKFDPIG